MATAHSANGLTTAQALERLDALYYQAVNALRNAIKTFIEEGSLPDAQARADGLF
ncbi:MAG: AMP nucleosidase, partial [Mixta calida]|nr:AMP nucleosidase [Mixta calida]